MSGRVGVLVRGSILSLLFVVGAVVLVDELHYPSAATISGRTLIPSLLAALPLLAKAVRSQMPSRMHDIEARRSCALCFWMPFVCLDLPSL